MQITLNIIGIDRVLRSQRIVSILLGFKYRHIIFISTQIALKSNWYVKIWYLYRNFFVRGIVTVVNFSFLWCFNCY